MNKLNLITVISVCLSFISIGQINKGGVPYSFVNEYQQPLKQEIETIEFDHPNRELLNIQDARAKEKGDPYRVATNLSANISPVNSGTWETLSNGDKLWRLRIKSANALALGLYFKSSIELPKGALLFLHNKNKNQVIGAFTAELNNVYNPIYATEMIQGDELYLEYYAPASTVGEPRIEISELAYYYRGVEDHVNAFAKKGETSTEAKAESCQVNVACSEANGWYDQVDAVVHYTFSSGSSTYVCTGAMIANTSQDCTPYLLTADHCGNKTTTTSLNTNVWYFKYENPNCSPGTTAPYSKPSTTMTGAIFRASSKNGSHSATSNQVYGSDFTLVELHSKPPSSYQVYYAGWDRRNISATSGVGIHHPAGHDKKISTFTSSLGSATYNGGLNAAHWEVVWSATANGHGVTEGGSSGSPIFNQLKRIVGDLSGGSSYCSAPTASDLYGKFSVSWDQLGSNSNAQLKAWLDPTGTGVQYMDGVRPPCSSTPLNCTATISSFPYTEGFESGFGLWTQDNGDDVDWTNHSGGTPSSNTGPSAANEGSNYLYIEASSPNYPSKNARLISPCFNLSSLTGTTVSFSYHMYGSNMGTLSVDISTDSGNSWTSNIWNKTGDQGNSWNTASIDLSAFDGQTIVLRLSGTTGNGYTSDMSIDGFSIQGGIVNTPSTCSTTITSYPYTEGFENGIGQWSQVSGDDIDWTNHSGSTPSSNTGASAAYEGSNYMYIEASSPNYPSKNAEFISPCFNLSNVTNPELTFAYHMYGAEMGTLYVDISTDAGQSWTNGIWSKSGNQTNTWNQANIDLSSYQNATVTIRLRGVTGNNYTSDICIDGIELNATEDIIIDPTPTSCNVTITNFPYTESFESGSGQWSQVSGDDLDWTNHSGTTPSSNTGASSAYEGSRYMYIEASSPNYPSKTASLESPCFDLSSITNPTMSFAYHMYGSSMGSLHLDYSTDAGANWTTDAWTVSGDQGNEWKIISLDLSQLVGNTVSFRLRGLTGNNYTSDICIDGFSIAAELVSNPSLTYCTPSPTNGASDGDYVGGVSLNTISNLNNGGGTSYKDYTNMSTTISRTGIYQLTIQEGAYAPDRYAAWIDYNQDGDFNDSGEKLGEFIGNSTGSNHTIQITVPSSATLGKTRLRVRCLYNNNTDGVDPCIDGDYGETEDYTVDIINTSKSRNSRLNNEIALDVSLYPNPSNGKFELAVTSEVNETLLVKITNGLGMVIQTRVIELKNGVTKEQFQVENVPSGTYYVVLSSEKVNEVKRIVIQ